MNVTLTIESDYDGYFEALVRGLIARQPNPKHHTIVVTAGPFRPHAVSFASSKGVLHLDFYSALRAGFGELSEQDKAELVDLI